MRAVAPPTPCFLTNYVFCHLRGAFCLHRVRPAMRRGLWRWHQPHSLFWSARFLIRDVVPVPQKHLGLHEMIAKSFCCWLYSRLPTMNARSYIVRALLFALVLVPSALRTSARPLGAPSCHVGKRQLRASPVDRHMAGDQLAASAPGHHAPAPRLHRIHGKKISISGGLTSTLRSYTPAHFLNVDARIGQQDMDGPNPSRGPPSPLSL
jgi:hypothetical protein